VGDAAYHGKPLLIVWYITHGHHPGDLNQRRSDQPWYQNKHEPSTNWPAPQNPCRHTNYGSLRTSTQPQHNPRLPAGLRRSRRLTAKLKRFIQQLIKRINGAGYYDDS
jgi:hypothetical protein